MLDQGNFSKSRRHCFDWYRLACSEIVQHVHLDLHEKILQSCHRVVAARGIGDTQWIGFSIEAGEEDVDPPIESNGMRRAVDIRDAATLAHCVPKTCVDWRTLGCRDEAVQGRQKRGQPSQCEVERGQGIDRVLNVLAQLPPIVGCAHQRDAREATHRRIPELKELLGGVHQGDVRDQSVDICGCGELHCEGPLGGRRRKLANLFFQESDELRHHCVIRTIITSDLQPLLSTVSHQKRRQFFGLIIHVAGDRLQYQQHDVVWLEDERQVLAPCRNHSEYKSMVKKVPVLYRILFHMTQLQILVAHPKDTPMPFGPLSFAIGNPFREFLNWQHRRCFQGLLTKELCGDTECASGHVDTIHAATGKCLQLVLQRQGNLLGDHQRATVFVCVGWWNGAKVHPSAIEKSIHPLIPVVHQVCLSKLIRRRELRF
mmetsp:Transcript_136404/g.436523  ORF Transcript_136404/g.436523 Transcript_136404/m.436523 type:complete len:429 (+) Transcript_136404:320-1606(+)